MSRARTAVHVAAATLAVLLAVALTASALPLQAPPATPKAATAAKVPEGHINITNDVTAPSEPKIVSKVNPVYPADAKKEKVQGIYLIDVVIGMDGSIKDARVAASATLGCGLHQAGPRGEAGALGREGRSPSRQRGRRRGQAVALRADPEGRKAGRVQGHVTVNFKLD